MNAPASIEAGVEKLLQVEDTPETESSETIEPSDTPEQESEVNAAETEDAANEPEDVNESDAEDQAPADDFTIEIGGKKFELSEENLERAIRDYQDGYTVKVNGEEQTVSREQLLQGYSGQAYVQQGMQRNAELHKQLNDLHTQMHNERLASQQALNLIQSGQFVPPPAPVDENLWESDPLAYMSAKKTHDEQLAAHHQQLAQLQQQVQMGQAAEQERIKMNIAREREVLYSHEPELVNLESNQPTPKAIELAEFLINHYGATPQTVAGVQGSLEYRVAMDAMRWHNSQKSAGEKAQKKTSAKVVKSSAKRNASVQSQARKKAKARLKKSGSIEDATLLMLDN